MPLGIPKVRYHLAGQYHSPWIDLYDQLFRERILFLTHFIEDETTNALVGMMFYLNSVADSPIYLYVNSPGGTSSCGLLIVDALQYINSTVITRNIGIAASMACFVVSRGGTRLALPHARFMLHQPEGATKGQATELFSETEQLVRLRRCICRLYVHFTGQPLNRIALEMDRETFLNSTQAFHYGLIDLVSHLHYKLHWKY